MDGLTLNVDLRSTAFLQELPVPRFLAQAAGLRSDEELANADPRLKKMALKAILGIKVSHLPLHSVSKNSQAVQLLCVPNHLLSATNEECGSLKHESF